MISFLAPIALFGLSLLAIPLILHLFKPRKVHNVPFSSLRWLRDSTQRLSKRFQWHQILLFLLRVGFIVCLVAAVARPILSRRDDGRFRDRFVVLDLGRGMNYREPGRPTPFEVAHGSVAEALNMGGQGDRATLILADRSPTAVGPVVADSDLYLSELRNVAPGMFPGRVSAAFDEVARMIDPEREEAHLEVVVITDFRYGGWNHGDIDEFSRRVGDRPLSIKVMDVGPIAPANAWIVDARLVEKRGGDRVIRVRAGAAGTDFEERRIRLTGLPGLDDYVEEVMLHDGRIETIEFPLPGTYELDRQVARVQLEPADALPDDDVYWVNLDQRADFEVVVVEPHRTAILSLQPGFHLRTALEAIAEDGKHALKIRRFTPETLAPDDLAAAHAVFLVDVPELSGALANALDYHVRAGTGIAVFLGPSVNRDFYNTHWALPDGNGLLPAPLGGILRFDRRDGNLGRLTALQATHPLLRDLVDPHAGDLGQIGVRAAFEIEDDPLRVGRTSIPATIANRTPAIMSRTVDAGQVVLFNLTADDTWSDLPRRPLFIPLMDRLLNYLTAGLLRRTFTAGSSVTLPIPVNWEEETLTITAPDGSVLAPRRRVLGGKTALQLDDTRQIGVYRMHPAGEDPERQGVPFVIHADRADSIPRRMNDEVLSNWLPHASVSVMRPDPETGRHEAIAASRSHALAPWLVVLAALFLAAEMFLAHWYCPRLGVVWK